MPLFRERRRRLVEAAVEHARDEYRELLDATGVVLVEGEDVSPAMTTVLGWDQRSFHLPGTLRGLVHPDDLPAYDRPEADVVVRVLAADGSHRQLLVRRTGTRELLVDLSRNQGHLLQTARFAESVEHAPHGVVVLEFADLADPDSTVLRSANPTARRMLHLEHHEVDGTRLDELFDRTSCRLVSSVAFDVAHTGQSLTAERLTFAEIPDAWIDVRIDRLADGSLAATFTDVTRHVVAEERLRHRASHDPLTGLPNRTLVEERLGVLTSELVADQHVALILVDVDGLSELNRDLGHQHGDRFVVEVANRLVRNVVGAELVARVGSSDFAVITRPAATQAETMERARSVSESLDGPLDVDGHLTVIESHIGIAVAPVHGADARTLLQAAESALQQARRTDDTVGVYEATSEPADPPAEGLITRLRRGLADQELELRYQPIVEVRSGRVAKVEAVLRWQHAEGRGQATDLLELAERSGLMQELTRWVFGEAARAAVAMPVAADPVRVCVNLPLVPLAESQLLRFVDLMVTAGELDPALIEIELSEADLTDDPVRAQQVVNRVSSLGIRVVIDGFGTGYTSASTLEHLQVRGIKIDRSYISTLAAVPADLVAVRATVELAHELGLSVGAEGVADGASLDLLAEVGCDYVQGFHISGPVTLDGLAGRSEELERALQGWAGTLRSGHAHAAGPLRD